MAPVVADAHVRCDRHRAVDGHVLQPAPRPDVDAEEFGDKGLEERVLGFGDVHLNHDVRGVHGREQLRPGGRDLHPAVVERVVAERAVSVGGVDDRGDHRLKGQRVKCGVDNLEWHGQNGSCLDRVEYRSPGIVHPVRISASCRRGKD